jgi:hypothetical protein
MAIGLFGSTMQPSQAQGHARPRRELQRRYSDAGEGQLVFAAWGLLSTRYPAPCLIPRSFYNQLKKIIIDVCILSNWSPWSSGESQTERRTRVGYGGCESASKVDPCFLGQVNELARRSALGPYAE